MGRFAYWGVVAGLGLLIGVGPALAGTEAEVGIETAPVVIETETETVAETAPVVVETETETETETAPVAVAAADPLAEAQALLASDAPEDQRAAIVLLRPLADAGDPAAMRLIAVSYDEGLGVPVDRVEAAGLYRRAAERGDAEAMTRLALLMEAGDGVARNLETARSYHLQAARAGHVPAMTHLAEFHRREDNSADALVWYERAAQAGDTGAMVAIGRLHLAGTGVARDPQAALRRFREASDLGDTAGTVALAALYEDGIGVARDIETAVSLYERAAEAGDVDAIVSFADALDWGRGIEQDRERAFALFKIAAEAGHARAMREVWLSYGLGVGVEEDPLAALEWMHRGAEAGDGPSLYELGVFYSEGPYFLDVPDENVTLDPGRGRALLIAAAQSEDADAAFEAMEYLALDDDPDFAFEWREKAAGAGSVDSMYVAGLGNAMPSLYGLSREDDDAAAVSWFRRFVENAGEDIPDREAKLADSFDWLCLLGDGNERMGWCLEAEQSGYAMYEVHLGYYFGTDGLPDDDVLAADYLYRSAKLGYDTALYDLVEYTANEPLAFRRRTQELLRADGYYTGPIDGAIGRGSMAAIRAAVADWSED